MLKEYPEYKETPAIWIDKIPSSWKSKKVRELYTERREKVSDKDYEPLSVCKAGIVPQLEDAVKTDNGDNRRLVKKGDFVINSRSDRKGSSGVSQYDGSVSLICITLKPITNENQFFMHYLLRSVPFTEEYYRNGHGLVADLWTTRYDEMQNIFLPIPPISEQNAIVKYLDYKTKQIDEFVSAKEKEIESLQDLKKSLVADAVTKGIAGEELVDSGIEWLPKVPKGWKSLKLKYTCKQRTEKYSSNYGNLEYFGLENIVKESGIFVETENEYELENSVICEKNDVVFGKLRPYLAKSWIVDKKRCCSSEFAVFYGFKGIPEFYKYLFLSIPFSRYIDSSTKGTKMPRANVDFIKSSLIAIPPIEEQNAIVEYLDKKTYEIDTLITSIQKQITLVKELRTKLIADAVTGNIDVREAI